MNKAQCLKCGDVIESRHRHDFQACGCGEIFIDGGGEYHRWGARDMSNFRRIEPEQPPKESETQDD